MARENLFEDFSRMANGAFSALNGVREEVEARLRDQIERMLERWDLVTREEFEVVKEMAAAARAEQEAQAARIAALESALAATLAAAGAASSPESRQARRPKAPKTDADQGADAPDIA